VAVAPTLELVLNCQSVLPESLSGAR